MLSRLVFCRTLMTNNTNTPDSGPVKPDAKKKAIRVIADLIHASNDMDVGYDWDYVLEVELNDGRWVMVTLKEIENPSPEAEEE